MTASYRPPSSAGVIVSQIFGLFPWKQTVKLSVTLQSLPKSLKRGKRSEDVRSSLLIACATHTIINTTHCIRQMYTYRFIHFICSVWCSYSTLCVTTFIIFRTYFVINLKCCNREHHKLYDCFPPLYVLTALQCV